MARIMIAEDDPDIAELLNAYLRDAKHRVGIAADGVAALELFHGERWDLVLLDLMLPKIDGYAVCELIRSESDLPIIMLTALDAEENQLKGFELKIDDYVTKPFSMPILLHKIEAVLRRSTGVQQNTSTLLYRDLKMDLTGYHVWVAGRKVELTHREFSLLQELLENQGRVLTRSVLLEQLWNFDFLGDERIVDSHIKNLRKKLDVDYIETVRGVGYRVEKMR